MLIEKGVRKEKCIGLKKSLKCTVVLSTLCARMMFPMMAQAEAEYETQKVSTYLFDMDHRTELTVAFKKDLPTIQ